VPEACYTTHATLNCPANLLSCHWRVQLPRLTPPTGSSTPGGSPYIPGPYVATIVAVDYAQQSSAAQYVYFTVI
jgi:hypothetical protein